MADGLLNQDEFVNNLDRAFERDERSQPVVHGRAATCIGTRDRGHLVRATVAIREFLERKALQLTVEIDPFSAIFSNRNRSMEQIRVLHLTRQRLLDRTRW